MNEHGRHAMETMKKHDPRAYAQIADSETHFSTLGREIRYRIWALSGELKATRLATDPISPHEFRTNAIAKNLDTFHDAFGVTEQDGMWMSPQKRVSIW